MMNKNDKLDHICKKNDNKSSNLFDIYLSCKRLTNLVKVVTVALVLTIATEVTLLTYHWRTKILSRVYRRPHSS